MQEKTSKEIRKTYPNGFITRIGTVDKYTSSSVYISSKIKLLNNDSDPNLACGLKNVRNRLVREIENRIKADNTLKKESIYDIKYSEHGFTYKKMTYFKYELYMCPVNRSSFSLVMNHIQDFAENLNTSLRQMMVDEELLD